MKIMLSIGHKKLIFFFFQYGNSPTKLYQFNITLIEKCNERDKDTLEVILNHVYKYKNLGQILAKQIQQCVNVIIHIITKTAISRIESWFSIIYPIKTLWKLKKKRHFLNFFFLFHFMCMHVLSTYLTVYHVCAWCRWRPEEGVRSMELGIEPSSPGRTSCTLNL